MNTDMYSYTCTPISLKKEFRCYGGRSSWYVRWRLSNKEKSTLSKPSWHRSPDQAIHHIQASIPTLPWQKHSCKSLLMALVLRCVWISALAVQNGKHRDTVWQKVWWKTIEWLNLLGKRGVSIEASTALHPKNSCSIKVRTPAVDSKLQL